MSSESDEEEELEESESELLEEVEEELDELELDELELEVELELESESESEELELEEEELELELEESSFLEGTGVFKGVLGSKVSLSKSFLEAAEGAEAEASPPMFSEALTTVAARRIAATERFFNISGRLV